MTNLERVKFEVLDVDRRTASRIERRFESISSTAEGFDVIDQDTHSQATELLKALKSLRKEIVSYWQPMKTQAHDLWKLIRSREKSMLDGVDVTGKSINGRLDAYENELAAKAEALRKEEEEKALAAAVALEDAGLEESAEAVLDVIDRIPVVDVTGGGMSVSLPKTEGVHFRTSPDFEVVDVSKIKQEFLIPDLKLIRKMVTAHGFDATKIVGEGIRVFEKKTRVVRT